MGNCQVKHFDTYFSLDANKTELTVTFDREPLNFDKASNLLITTDSSWVEGTDYSVRLEGQSSDPKTKKLIFSYLKAPYEEQLTVNVKQIQHLVGSPSATYNLPSKSFSFLVSSEDPGSLGNNTAFGMSASLEKTLKKVLHNLAEYG